MEFTLEVLKVQLSFM